MSTQQVRIQTGLLTSQVVLAGITQVFHKSTIQSGDVEPGGLIEPSSLRLVKNIGNAVCYLGGAAVTTATGYRLEVNESFVVAGPSGSGYVGDLYAVGTDGQKVAVFAC